MSGPGPDIALSAVTDRAALSSLQAEWQQLYRESASPQICLAPYWCARMWDRQAASGGRRPVVIVGRLAGRVRLIWPLVSYRSRSWRIVRGLSENMADFDDMLVAEDPDADRWRRQAWDFATATLRPDMVLFRRLAQGSGLDRLVDETMTVSQRSSVSLVVDLRGIADWSSYLRTRNKGFRKALRRAPNWLARFGEVRCEVVSDEATAISMLDWMLEQKHRRLGRHAANTREKTEHLVFGQDMPFYRDVCSHAIRQGEMKVVRLTAGDRIVAVDTLFRFGKRAVGWLHAFDDDFMPASPGNYVCTQSLAWAWQQGVENYDLMPEPDSYKYIWTEQGYGVRDVRVAMTAWGKVLVTWHRGSLRGMALALYMRAPRPMQMAIRRLLR